VEFFLFLRVKAKMEWKYRNCMEIFAKHGNGKLLVKMEINTEHRFSAEHARKHNFCSRIIGIFVLGLMRMA
jgi:hypothetical protein